MAYAKRSQSATLVVLARSHLTWMGIIDDPIALHLLPPRWKPAARILRLPGLQGLHGNPTFAYLAARTLFFDEFLTQAIADGVGQVVVLGAGYDSRSWRLRSPGVAFFEVDRAATQSDKRSRAPAGGPTYVSCDVTDPSFADHLLAAGYQSGVPTAFTAEGLTLYLTEQDTCRLLATLAQLGGKKSQLAVNFGAGFERQGSGRGRLGRRAMAAGGERFQFRLHMADAPEFLDKTGWTIVWSLPGPELRDTYLRGTPLARTKVTTTGFAIQAARRNL